LSAASGIGTKTIADFERGASTPYERTLRDLREAFEAAGIEFTSGDAPGVRLKPRKAARGNEDQWQRVARTERSEIRDLTSSERTIGSPRIALRAMRATASS